MAFGRSLSEPESITVWVAPRTDLTDEKTYPEVIGGHRVTYLPTPVPKRPYA